jgi:hypothetical protein
MTRQLEETVSAHDSSNSHPVRESSLSPAVSPPELKVDDTGAILCYANFCRVTGTPEELILDFGLNPQHMGEPTKVEIKQRLVVNYYTAKRLFQAQGLSIGRHEAAFGYWRRISRNGSLRRFAGPLHRASRFPAASSVRHLRILFRRACSTRARSNFNWAFASSQSAG